MTLACPTESSFAQLRVDSVTLTGTRMWDRIVNASAPIRGTYLIGLNGSWTAPLNWNDGPDTIRTRLLSLGMIDSVKVTMQGDANDGLYIVLDIDNPVVLH